MANSVKPSAPGQLDSRLSQVPFQDPERARQNLALIAGLVPAAVARALPPLLHDIPDPDAALNLFERMAHAAGPELLHLLGRQPALAHYALVVFGFSQFLGETLIQNLDLFHAFQREEMLDRSYSREDYRESFARFRSRSFETDMAVLLARFKRREYIRIMLRDVLGIATLAEVTGEISSLADVLIEEALREVDAALRNRYGPPQHIDGAGRLVDTPAAVLSLGKLGGNELNYSSDVDLLFLYGDGEDAGTISISLREYFIRLAQGVTEVLSRATREGWTYRIDLRLRPQGGEGEPAIALGQALRYYAEVAHDWELQAMIKVRYSAGDMELARRFIRGVQPFVYGGRGAADPSAPLESRSEAGQPAAAALTPAVRLNFAAIETALETRDRIQAHRRAAAVRGDSIDVKLDRGGIRDIEFLVQCLQRVYGGKERWLRSGGTLFSLQKLHDKGHISGKEFQALTTAYEFLRRLEHRLQLQHGQQTHRLPGGESDLLILYRSMGGEMGEYRPSGIEALVRKRMAAVAEIYSRIIHQQQAQQQREESEFTLQGPASELSREYSDRQILQRLAEDSPGLYEIASRELPAHVRRNLFRFLSAAFTSSERYAAVAEAPHAVERALELFATSEYLSDILVRHPEEIATLETLDPSAAGEDAGRLFPALGGVEEGSSSSDPVFEYLASASVSFHEKLALLRQHYRHRVFASGARDVVEARVVYHSLAESTSAADEAIAAALDIAGHPEGFAVLALGRLGSLEFDLLSDADIIFLRDEGLDSQSAIQIAEQMMQALSAYTREGTAFAVDTRLRPNGAEGELVMTPAHLEDYFAHEAQAWEALTYTKLRFVAGSAELGDSALEAAGRLGERFAAEHGFLPALRGMRQRMEKNDAREPNFKTGPGGFYDIDFLVSQLLVRNRLQHARGNVEDRIQLLRARALLSDADGAALSRAALLLRTLEHAVRLVTGRARKNLPLAGYGREASERLAARILRAEFAGGLEAELDRAMAATREIYRRLMQ